MKPITCLLFAMLLAGMMSCEREDVLYRTADCGDNPVEIQSNCYEDRAMVRTYTNQPGMVIQMEPGRFAIVPEGDSIRLDDCNLPEPLKAEGMRIQFSGEQKEVYPNEKWAAYPFNFTCVSRQ